MKEPVLIASKVQNRDTEPVAPLVSVVIPCFNHEEFIRDAIVSADQQTYGNIEIIIVDDGSADNSVALINKIIPELSRSVRFYLKDHQGAHEAINFGIGQSRGEFITLLNSDDLFEKTRIEILVDSLLKTGGRIAFTRVAYIDEAGNKLSGMNDVAVEFSLLQARIKDYPSVGFCLLDNNAAISSGNLFFTKSLFEDIGGFRKLKNCHDWDFILRALRFDEPLFINEELYYYRFHEKNASREYKYIARIEGNRVKRNFFWIQWRADFANIHYPCRELWPDYYPSFIQQRGYAHYIPGNNLFQKFIRSIYRFTDSVLLRFPGK